ncbi:Asp-tRNA(Asn)/Glu-tRNA(Gln) amidotransferase subunit GatC [Nitrosomonadales bacterium]|jgi:aspartyl-tRNA(Asn)/glutamyl-tRNA(Gln) amidotransferase subunit C|nr:Asp-tRNA(Asn)/Glu-tRNA(Gln) amidotransferase subunit GatC [Methylophilaceae bacterium]MDA9600371.1 Asp-tRNA(Asn)/Glu-tRNA(Gln) amidotransferase subunit GatC [Nitrosomonadales bacterium]
MKFDNDEIKKIAHLARINIDENEANKVSEKLEGILRLIDQMTQVNTDSIEPMAHALDITQPLREDKVTEVDIREKSLKLSNETDQSLFIVPRVIE